MTDYEVRLDYTDGTFEVVTIPADNYGEARAIAEHNPDVAWATVLAMIDREPQAVLAVDPYEWAERNLGAECAE